MVMKVTEAMVDSEIDAELSKASQALYEDQARRKVGEFIKGPMPMPWLERAFGLGGKAAAVAVLLWFMAGMNGPREIRVTPRLLKRFNVSRQAGYRAVHALAAEGLITAETSKGKCAVVSIVSTK